MLKKGIAIGMSLLLVIAVSSCGRQERQTPERNETEQETSIVAVKTENTSENIIDSQFLEESIPETEMAENANHEKYNSYVSLSNYAFGTLYSALERYFDQLGSEEKPNHERAGVIALFTISEYDIDIIKEAAAYAEMEPLYTDVDPKTKNLTEITLDIAKQLQAAEKYYRNKDYVDDEFVKGDEIHSSLLENIEPFETALSEFNLAFDVIVQKARIDELARMKEEGNMEAYYASICLDDMNAIAEVLVGISAENVQDLSIEIYKPLYDRFVVDFNELSSIYDEMDKSDSVSISFLGDLVDRYAAAKAAAAALLEVLQSGENFDSSYIEIAELLDGTPEYLLSTFSDCFEQYNTWYINY